MLYWRTDFYNLFFHLSLPVGNRPRFRSPRFLQNKRHGMARGAELCQRRGKRVQHFLPWYPRGRLVLLVAGHHGDEIQPLLLPV